MINSYAPVIGAPKYIKQLLMDLKGEIDSNTIVGNLNTHLQQWINHPDKVSKKTAAFNETLGQMDLINVYRTFYPNAAEYIFSSAHGTFSRIDHMLGQKRNQ